mmetsp:Transcript_6512/g.21758  ORF Transcript_6512/g.21758 Transcript_6512/m.21758 type:complete len:292 (+) Transcript_6512:218-1093(+)
MFRYAAPAPPGGPAARRRWRSSLTSAVTRPVTLLYVPTEANRSDASSPSSFASIRALERTPVAFSMAIFSCSIRSFSGKPSKAACAHRFGFSMPLFFLSSPSSSSSPSSLASPFKFSFAIRSRAAMAAIITCSASTAVHLNGNTAPNASHLFLKCASPNNKANEVHSSDSFFVVPCCLTFKFIGNAARHICNCSVWNGPCQFPESSSYSHPICGAFAATTLVPVGDGGDFARPDPPISPLASRSISSNSSLLTLANSALFLCSANALSSLTILIVVSSGSSHLVSLVCGLK